MKKILTVLLILVFCYTAIAPAVIGFRIEKKLESILIENRFEKISDAKFRAEHLEVSKLNNEIEKEFKLWHELDSYDVSIEYGLWPRKRQLSLHVSSSSPRINNPMIPPPEDLKSEVIKSGWIEVEISKR